MVYFPSFRRGFISILVLLGIVEIFNNTYFTRELVLSTFKTVESRVFPTLRHLRSFWGTEDTQDDNYNLNFRYSVDRFLPVTRYITYPLNLISKKGGDRNVSFAEMAQIDDTDWKIPINPDVYLLYPQGLSLPEVVQKYRETGLVPESPVNNPSLSVIHSSNLVCTAGNTNSYATMIIVKSALTNYAQRLRLRQVIRKQTAQINVTVAILFSLGLPSNGKVPPELVQEITQFDDILLANYTDTYMNLTLKTITNLRFVHRHCLHTSPSFVFLDDDHGINLTQLHEFFSKLSLSEVRRSIFGFINSKSPVLRTRKSKWFTEPEAFPFPKYPDYAAGPCYIIGAELIPKFSIAAAFTQFFPVEDVFLGIITAKFGLRVHPLPNVYLHRSKPPRRVFPLVAGLDFFGRKLNI
uniref:Hexosyltransferase n=2 Tax=Schistocephalus solidus TaxID=70667 RepID=A0A0V0J5J1_SCHSO